MMQSAKSRLWVISKDNYSFSSTTIFQADNILSLAREKVTFSQQPERRLAIPDSFIMTFIEDALF